MNTAPNYVWPHLAELPAFRALIRSIEHRLLDSQKPFARPILDIGAGDGHFAAVALQPLVDVGIDVDLPSLHAASQRRIYRQLIASSATDLPFPDNYFATIISNCVIEHIPDLHATLGEMYRTLRPGGQLLLTVPTDRLEANFLIPTLLKRIGLHSLANAYLDWFRGVQVHYHLLSREQWMRALREAGFQVEQTRGYMSRRATQVFELGHYAGVDNLLARRLTGQWVVWPWRPRFVLLEWLLTRFVYEAPDACDSCFFMLACKPGKE